MPVALVTGVRGQDGSLLAELLTARGYRVVGVSRADLDIAEHPETLAEIVASVRPDEVYHLAAAHRSSEPGTVEDEALHRRMTAVNYAAPLALARGLLALGRGRLVFAASSQMYTPALPPPRIDETTPRAPSSFYGQTKARTLDELAELRRTRGLAASTAILFNHESPRRLPAFVSRKITQAVARIAAGRERELVLLDTSSRADFSSARDIVEGLHAMALGTPGDYVLASGELHGIDELCAAAFSAVGLDWRDHVRSTRDPGERPALVGDPSLAEHELGWLRRRSFAEWVREMVEAET